MAVVIETGPHSFGATQLGLHNYMKDLCVKAGFPVPFQEYTATSPYFLVYQFDTNNFFVLSTTSSTVINYTVYKAWNTGTRTGTGNLRSTLTTLTLVAGTNANTYSTMRESSGAIGMVKIINSANTSIRTWFGFIKLANPASYYPPEYPQHFFTFGTVASTFANLVYTLYSTVDSYGTKVDTQDILSPKNIPNTTGITGNLSLRSPVILYSGGYIVGSSDAKVAYCPPINTLMGQRLIVTPGVEEYVHMGADIAVRDI